MKFLDQNHRSICAVKSFNLVNLNHIYSDNNIFGFRRAITSTEYGNHAFFINPESTYQIPNLPLEIGISDL